MFVRVRFPEAIAVDSIRVPQRAVQGGPQGQFVLVVGAEARWRMQPVTTSGMAGSDFIIADGLKGGEQVIVNGLQKARPAPPVKAVPWNAGAPRRAAKPRRRPRRPRRRRREKGG